jgi:hypothetical protein
MAEFALLFRPTLGNQLAAEHSQISWSQPRASRRYLQP